MLRAPRQDRCAGCEATDGAAAPLTRSRARVGRPSQSWQVSARLAVIGIAANRGIRPTGSTAYDARRTTGTAPVAVPRRHTSRHALEASQGAQQVSGAPVHSVDRQYRRDHDAEQLDAEKQMHANAAMRALVRSFIESVDRAQVGALKVEGFRGGALRVEERLSCPTLPAVDASRQPVGRNATTRAPAAIPLAAYG